VVAALSNPGFCIILSIMSNVAPALTGSLLGLGLGWIAWLLAGRFVAGYRSRPSVQEAADRADGERGSVPPGAVLTSTVMAGWGGYVGWAAPGPDVAGSALIATAILLCLALVDFQVRRLPNPLVLALLGWAVVQSFWLGYPTLEMAALGLAVAGAIFLVLAIIGRGALGIGDVKLEAAIGALVGFPAVLLAVFAGVVAGGVAAVFLLVTRKAGRKDPMAYGPYLALGAWLILVRVLGLWP
jgi:prepilin signal peptidase PulO-like enzyme (type II secretory pathway)